MNLIAPFHTIAIESCSNRANILNRQPELKPIFYENAINANEFGDQIIYAACITWPGNTLEKDSRCANTINYPFNKNCVVSLKTIPLRSF